MPHEQAGRQAGWPRLSVLRPGKPGDKRFKLPGAQICLLVPALFALLLAACDGGSSGAPAPGTLSPALVSAVENAPAIRSVGDSVLTADAYFVPPSAEGDFAPIPAGPSLSGSQRAGGMVLLASSGAAMDIRSMDVRRVVAVTGDGGVEFARDAFLLSPLDDAGNRVALLLPEGFSADYLAVEIADVSGRSAWLGARLHPGRLLYRVYSQGQFTGGSGWSSYQPVLRAQFDYSGASASLATVLRKFGMDASESIAMEGLLRFGEADKIVERRGFSLLDMKLFLTALGLDSAGYGLTDLRDLDSLRAGAGEIIIPVDLFGVRHFAVQTRYGDQYLYLASPLFGNVAVPLAELDTVWPPVAGTVSRVAFVAWPPAPL